jgi:DNA-binding LacI/PurR family transcriptional regulator
LVKLQASGVPVVACNRPIPALDCPGVLMDPFQMGCLAGGHFASTGRKRIACFAAYRYTFTEQYLLGLRLGLLEGGVRLDESCIQFGEDQEISSVAEEHHDQQIAAFLDANPELDGALLSPGMAVRLISELRKRNRRVPEDVAVIAMVDNAVRLADSEVPVTAVAVDQRQLGHLIGDFLLRMANGEALTAADSTTVTSRLIARRSAP